MHNEEDACIASYSSISTLPCHGQRHLPLVLVAQSPIQPGLERIHGGGSHRFSGQPGAGPHHPHSKEFLSYTHSKSTLFQPEAITPCPIPTCPCKKSLSGSLVGPLQVLKSWYKISLEPSLLQTEQPQLSQPFFTGEVFHSSDNFCVPPLDPLQQLHGFPVLRAPELDAGLHVGSHAQSRAEGQNRLPQPAAHASFDAAQDTAGLLGCEHLLMGHVDLLVPHHPQVLLLRPALNPFSAYPVFVLVIAPTHVQDLAFGLERLEVCTGPPLKDVQDPPDGIPSLQHNGCTTQLGVIGKFADGRFNTIVHVPNKDVKHHQSQYRPLRNATHYWSPLGH